MNETIIHPQMAADYIESTADVAPDSPYSSKTRYYDTSKNGTLKYPRIPMCGHKFIGVDEPRHRHCESCWFTFFQVHGQLTQAVEEAFQKQGDALIIKLKSRRFLNNFLKFMSTIHTLKATQEAAALKEKATSESTGSIEGSDGREAGYNAEQSSGSTEQPSTLASSVG